MPEDHAETNPLRALRENAPVAFERAPASALTNPDRPPHPERPRCGFARHLNAPVSEGCGT